MSIISKEIHQFDDHVSAVAAYGCPPSDIESKEFEFDIVLNSIHQISTVKAVICLRKFMDIKPNEAFNLIKSAPVMFMSKINYLDALKIKHEFDKIEAFVQIIGYNTKEIYG